jgi:hypothetical protein
MKGTAEAYFNKQGQIPRAPMQQNVEYGDYSQFNLLMSPADDFLHQGNRGMDTIPMPPVDTSEQNFLRGMSSPHATPRSDPMAFAVDNIMAMDVNHSSAATSGTSSPVYMGNTDDSRISPPPRHHQRSDSQSQGCYSPRARIPSLREIRAMNSPPAMSVSSPYFPAKYDEPSRQMTSELTTFCSTIFTMHTEMAGISAAVAEYMTWVRKSLISGGADPACAAVLETLEACVRELQEMAETRPRDAWTTLLDTLKKSPIDEHLFAVMSSIELEAQERVEKMRRFFQENYDVSMRLSDQLPELRKD